jgi:hypothetical protein
LNLFEIAYRLYTRNFQDYLCEVYESESFDKSKSGKLLILILHYSCKHIAEQLEIYVKEKRSCAEHLTNLKRIERDTTESKLKQNVDRLEKVEQKLNTLIKTRKKEADQVILAFELVKK